MIYVHFFNVFLEWCMYITDFFIILFLHMRSSIYWKPSWTFQFIITLDKSFKWEGKQRQAMPHLWGLAFLHSESTSECFIFCNCDMVQLAVSYPVHKWMLPYHVKKEVLKRKHYMHLINFHQTKLKFNKNKVLVDSSYSQNNLLVNSITVLRVTTL